MDLEYIQAKGWDYTLFINLDSETAYTVFALVENIYGKVTLFHSTHTTEAAESAKKGGANLRPAVKMNEPLHKQFSSINAVSVTSMK